MKTLYLIDASGFIFRAFYALPSLTRPDGTPVGAVFGFCNMLLKLRDIILEKSAYQEKILWAGIFDVARHNFRHEIDPLYKANRGETPEELIPQFSLIREACQAFGCPVKEVPHFEADDVIASYAQKALQNNIATVIVSSDKDLMQLYKNGIEIYDPMKSKWILEKDIYDKFGVEPEKVVDVQALAGDTSDGITGIPGIGIKTAAELIKQFGSLEVLLNHAHTLPQKRRRELLITYADQARTAKKLVTLRSDVKVALDENDLQFHALLTPEDRKRIADFCSEQGFLELKKRFKDLAPPKNLIIVHNISTKEEWLAFQRISFPSPIALQVIQHKLKSKNTQNIGIVLTFKEKNSFSCWILKISDQLTWEIIVRGLFSIEETYSLLIYDTKEFAHISQGNYISSSQEDLQLMAYILQGRQEKTHQEWKQEFNLDSLHFLDKSEDPEIQEALIISLQLHYLKEKFYKQFEKNPELLTVYQDLDKPFLQPIYKMERHGIFVDSQELQNFSTYLDKKLNSLQQKIYILAGSDFNLASPQQLGKVLFEDLGITPFKKSKTGHYQTDSSILTELAITQNLPILYLILEWRKFFKLRSTYTDSLISCIHPQTHRIHSTFLLTNTNTGRLASQNPNLQNIPIRTPEGEKIRQAFKGEGKNILASFDYSQIELRLLAYMGKVKALIQAFENKEDIHKITASHIFNKPISKIDANLRRKAKTVNFGIVYGQSQYGLAQQLQIDYQEAKSIIDAYFNTYPEIKDFTEECKNFARKNGYVETLFKRRCFIPSIHHKNFALRQFAERQSINAPLQGSNADIMKKAMIKIDKILDSTSVRMVLQVHDELVFEGEKNDIEQLSTKIQNIMETILLDSHSLAIPLIVNFKIGKTWAEAHS